LSLSWQKAKKLLGRTEPANRLARHQSTPRPDPERRENFIGQIGSLLDGVREKRHTLVYLDEAHIHQDVDPGHGWCERGQRFCGASSSPGLAAKVSFHRLYLHNKGQVQTWPYPRANGEHTAGTRIAATDAAPLWLWQSRQWQRNANMTSPSLS
jgi:hypothetical protein